mgnify:CR=1 FL=1
MAINQCLFGALCFLFELREQCVAQLSPLCRTKCVWLWALVAKLAGAVCLDA